MKKILICEDEFDIQHSLAKILKGKDYSVYAARDGAHAIACAKEINPDLILMDIRMPRIDGLEATKEIRSFNSKTKLIFITAFESPELIKEAAKYDISNYLVKPVSSQDILKAIESALA